MSPSDHRIESAFFAASDGVTRTDRAAVGLVLGRRVFPWLLWQVTRTGSRELFTLCVVAAAVSIAFASAALFGVSFALTGGGECGA